MRDFRNSPKTALRMVFNGKVTMYDSSVQGSLRDHPSENKITHSVYVKNGYFQNVKFAPYAKITQIKGRFLSGKTIILSGFSIKITNRVSCHPPLRWICWEKPYFGEPVSSSHAASNERFTKWTLRWPENGRKIDGVTPWVHLNMCLEGRLIHTQFA